MALSADTSPPPPGRDPGQPAENGGVGGTAEPARDAASRDSATLPGLPRLFFADEPDPPQEAPPTGPFGQPGGGPQEAMPGQPGSFGQPDGPGGQARPGLPGGFGQPRRPAELTPTAQRPAEPPRTTRPTRPSRPPDRELRQRGIASLLLGVLSLIALFGLGGNSHRFVYLLIFSAVIGVASAVIGMTAVLKARRTGSYRPRGSIGGILLGTLAALLSVPILVLYIAFPRQVDTYITCLSQAQTTGGDEACLDRFYRSTHLGTQGLGSARAGGHGSADGPPVRRPEGAESPFFAHLSR